MSASAGSRTRIDCLEGNHANRYTTDAFFLYSGTAEKFIVYILDHVWYGI